jgi:RNA polymerase sigma-70 factor (family 1)
MTEKESKIEIQRLRAGDEQVYLDIYHRYNKRLYSFAFQYLKSHELAQDVVQEVFIKLWEHRQEINTSAKGFLFTSVRNHVLNMIRNNRRKTLKKIQIEQERKRPVNKTEEVILYSEYQRILAMGVDELPVGKREIFDLKTVQGLSNDEIASKLDITINTVKSQYYQASKFIKKYLEEHADIRESG